MFEFLLNGLRKDLKFMWLRLIRTFRPKVSFLAFYTSLLIIVTIPEIVKGFDQNQAPKSDGWTDKCVCVMAIY